MKKYFLLPLLILMVITAGAQIKTDTSRIIKKTSVIVDTPAKKMTRQPVTVTKGTSTQTNTQSKPESTPTQPQLTDADYYLAGAVIKINTGSDNKEPNTSTASLYVRPRKSNGAVAYKMENYANEIKINQDIDFRLDRATTLNAPQNSLQYFKQNGLNVLIVYCNKTFCTDAWKINSISLTIEFKDINGNPTPGGYASRTINFPVSSGTLGFVVGCNPFWRSDPQHYIGYSDQKLKMLLKTDEYFNAMPANLLDWFSDDVN